MNYPKEFLQDLNDKSDIVSIAMQYAEPKPAGLDYVCKCPFHSEKTASLHLYTADNSFYCFGCGTGGTAVHFLMNAEGYTFTEAVAELAKRAGMAVPDPDRDSDEYKKTLQRSRIFEMNRTAAKFYRDILWGLGDAGGRYADAGLDGRIYLGARGVSEQIAKRFGLGYAPKTFDALKSHLRANGYYDREMLAAGLMASKDGMSASGEAYVSVYDKFRGRLMFPIIDLQGNVAGFSGRITDKTDERSAKYLNSPETAVFRKREICFALNFVRKAVSAGGNAGERADYVLLCEGNLDVVSLHQAGFTTAAATLGTAVTDFHARLLRDRIKGLKRVITVFDSDAAGQKATEKALRILSEAGITADVLTFDHEDAKDPDEYIKKYGGAAFANLLANSTPKLDYQLKRLIAEADTATVDGRQILLQRGCKFIAQTIDKNSDKVLISELARACQTGEDGVRGETDRQRFFLERDKKKRAEEQNIYGGTGRKHTSSMGEGIAAVRRGRRINLEKELLRLLMCGGEIDTALVRTTALSVPPHTFADEFCRKLYESVAGLVNMAGESAKITMSQLSAEFSPEEWGIIQGIRNDIQVDDKQRESMLESTISLLVQDKSV
ncbi:hypothetical protein FACS1894120_1710 [Clostridia bacterium]|nr:hypothetical protein FACS1894120_1710 [Clostridia bacterium]